MRLFRTMGQASNAEKAAEARLVALETHIKALYDHVEQLQRENRELVRDFQALRQDEARREAEHATMVDRLARLYKRVATRITREEEPPTEESIEESVLDMRRRLGRL